MSEFEAYKSGPTREGLEALLRAQAGRIYNVCFQVLRDGSLAEDASQQVLLNLVKDLPRLSNEEHFRAWISRASFHAALDLKRAARRRRAHEQEKSRMKSPTGLSPDEAEAVHAEIARLEDPLRAVVVEHFFEKRPLARVASDQGCSEATIWNRLQQAKERLRQALAQGGLAAVAPGVDGFLEGLAPVAAPPALLKPALLANLALSGGAMAVKSKVMIVASAMILGMTSGGIAVRSSRAESPAPPRPASSAGLAEIESRIALLEAEEKTLSEGLRADAGRIEAPLSAGGAPPRPRVMLTSGEAWERLSAIERTREIVEKAGMTEDQVRRLGPTLREAMGWFHRNLDPMTLQDGVRVAETHAAMLRLAHEVLTPEQLKELDEMAGVARARMAWEGGLDSFFQGIDPETRRKSYAEFSGYAWAVIVADSYGYCRERPAEGRALIAGLKGHFLERMKARLPSAAFDAIAQEAQKIAAEFSENLRTEDSDAGK